jgi:uncharacterized membrane protein YsdA (DUF1294 family)/cold shock CspA family protein
MRYHGKLTGWKDEKGFGFVAPHSGGDKIFVHIKAFIDRDRRPLDGDTITYDLAFDRERRARAENIRFLLSDSPKRRRARTEAARHSVAPVTSYYRYFIVLLFGCVLTAVYFFFNLSIIIPILYLVVSTITFLFYTADKSAAKKRQRRTHESILHRCCQLGGCPGAMLAQNRLRHKSKKKEFQQVFWFLVVVNCCALIWLCTNKGLLFVKSILSLVFIPDT